MVRIWEHVQLEAFVFNGVPTGRHRDRMIQHTSERLAHQDQNEPVLEVLHIDLKTGAIWFTTPPESPFYTPQE